MSSWFYTHHEPDDFNSEFAFLWPQCIDNIFVTFPLWLSLLVLKHILWNYLSLLTVGCSHLSASSYCLSPTLSSWSLYDRDHVEGSLRLCLCCLPVSLWSLCSLDFVSLSMSDHSRVSQAIKSLLCFILLSHLYWILLFTPWEIRKCKGPWESYGSNTEHLDFSTIWLTQLLNTRLIEFEWIIHNTWFHSHSQYRK